MKSFYRLFVLLCTVMLLPLLPLSSGQNMQRIIPIDSPLITTLNQLALEQGVALLSSAGPWSVDEINAFFHTIPTDRLSASGTLYYDKVAAELADLAYLSDKRLSGDFTFSAAIEGYYHTNSTDFTEENDWYFDAGKRAPLALIEIEASLLEFASLYTDFGLKKNRFASPTDKIPPVESLVFAPTFSTNLVPMSFQDFDTPDRAYLSMGGNGYSLQFGRDRLSWGPGYTGNFVIGDQHKYEEFLRFTFYTDTFKFTSATLFMDPPNWTSNSRSPYYPKDPDDPAYQSKDEYTVRMFLAHRFEFRPLSWLRIEFSENVMYQDTVFSMKYLNPLFIFHNLSNRGQFNAIADLSIQATVAKGVSLYAAVTVDQIEAPGEGSDQANALGYMIGVEGYVPKTRGGLSYRFEGVYTDPLLYRRDKVDFIIMTREREQYYGFVPAYRYLGYRYGGDAIVVYGNLEWRDTKPYRVGSDIAYMAHGEVSIDKTEYDAFGARPKGPTPSGAVTHTIRGGLYISYPFNITGKVQAEAGLRADLLGRYTDRWTTDLQVTATFALSV